MKKSILVVYLILVTATLSVAQEYESYKKLADTTFFSENLGFDKNISVVVPFEWQADIERDFPLIIIFDRQNQRSNNYILNTIDYLTSTDQMPSSIIISVESDQEHRYLETAPKVSSPNGLMLENEKFIFNELIPLAEKQFRASNFRLFIGHSRYGYFTTSLLFSRLNELNAIVSLSPFFIEKNVDLTDSIKLLKNQKFNSTKYYRFGIGNDYPKQYAKMDSILKIEQPKSVDIKGTLFQEAGHYTTPGLTIASSLYDIFEEWSKIQGEYFSNDQKDLTVFNSLNTKIKNHYGGELVFSLGILNGKGWFFYGKEDYAKAIEAWEILLKTYPNFSQGYLALIDAQIQLKLDFSKSVDRFKQSLTKSTIYSDIEKEELIQELEELIKSQ
jgi:tetratricopeptide (TPR) repeat protein